MDVEKEQYWSRNEGNERNFVRTHYEEKDSIDTRRKVK